MKPRVGSWRLTSHRKGDPAGPGPADIVAVLGDDASGKTWYVVSDPREHHHDPRVDGALLAAAPDMYEALKLAVWGGLEYTAGHMKPSTILKRVEAALTTTD